ncbi:MAG: cation transporter [Candidatus Eisenbacteria bacterium]|uniref:Cation transporter n=1 Tax=Eiseniibacteriota bacterium TaxID=2212470 RepID=A0A933SBI8_UNCEI|nr:cation transporter [Candidatus Eisenbacteria bacterium]
MSRAPLTRFALLSMAAALLTIALKATAYFLTGSVGLLSDALESLVNLAGAIMALAMLDVAARPEDDDHPYGHGKAEYFSSGVEGTLILVAAVSIAWAALDRLRHPQPLESVGVGLAVSVAAAVLNLVVGLVLLRAAKKHDSITLEANAHHLMTDVWTSVGVILGVGLVAATHWAWFDSVVALAVAANIVWTGVRIVRDSVLGLMDTALHRDEQAALLAALEPHRSNGVDWHALRSRQSGSRRFVSLHVLVPGDWSVHDGHQLLERIEADIRRAVPNVHVLTHLESLDDPASYDDIGLDRPAAAPDTEHPSRTPS